MRKKLAIISTHPIQYYGPVFQLLAKQLELKVFYTWGEQSIDKYDQGFGQLIKWDIPLLEGYDYMFLENISKDPGSHHFNGIINPTLIQEVERFEPDAILIYGWAWKSHLKALRFFKGKISTYFRGDSTILDQQKNFKSLLRKLFLKWVYSHVDKAFYVGTSNKAYFKHFGLKEEQLFFTPHAIDNERFSKDKYIEASSLRAKLSIASDETVILFTGKLECKKNPEILLEAFINLDLKDTHLLFVGNGELENALKGKVGPFDSAQGDNGGSLELGVESWEKKTDEKSFDYAQDDKLEGKLNDNEDSLELGVGGWEEKIKKRIHFMDFQNQTAMPVVYQACDLFCLPSQGPGETWGLAVNEAMAAGKAVLVSDKVGCAVDLVKTGVNGAVFKSGDLADLKQKLNALTENKDKLAQMGLASQQIIKDWSFKKQVAVIVNTIENKHAK
jgi:glycosyltransferase involved in cell wall biosynthesis